MAARRNVRPIGLYDVRELRRPVVGLPAAPVWALPHDNAPVVLNAAQPVIVPEFERSGRGRYAMDVPITIEVGANGRFVRPGSWNTLKFGLRLQRRKIERFVSELGLDADTYKELGLAKPDESTAKMNSRAFVDTASGVQLRPNEFDRHCRERAAQLHEPTALRKRSDNGFDVLNSAAKSLLKRSAEALRALHSAKTHFNGVHRGFAEIVLRSARDGQILTLHGLHGPFEHLPSSVTNEHLLDVAYFGLINPAVIYVNYTAVADLLGLVTVVGRANLGVVGIDVASARTFLAEVMGEGEPCVQVHAEFRPSRSALTAAMIQRYGLVPYLDKIARICRDVEAQGRSYEAVQWMWPLV